MNAYLDLLISVAIVFATFIVTFFVNSVIDWYLHAKVLHGPAGTPPSDWHLDHHHDHAGRDYNSAHEGETFGLAPQVFWNNVATVGVAAGAISFLTGFVSIFVTATVSSIAFWKCLEIVHRRSHNPKPGGWFEKTWIYKCLDRSHRVHHAREDRAYTIMFPPMDLAFGTHPSQLRAEDDDCEESNA